MTSPDGTTPVQAQIVPTSPSDEELRVDYYNASASPVAWLVWQADVPAAGLAVYFVTPVASANNAPHTAISTLSTLGAADAVLANGVLTLTISAETGMLSEYSNSLTNVNAMLSQEWCWYNASAGNNVEDSQVGALQRSPRLNGGPTPSNAPPLFRPAAHIFSGRTPRRAGLSRPALQTSPSYPVPSCPRPNRWLRAAG